MWFGLGFVACYWFLERLPLGCDSLHCQIIIETNFTKNNGCKGVTKQLRVVH